MPRVRRKPQGFGQNQRVRQRFAPQPDRSFPRYERPGNRMDPMAKRRVQRGGPAWNPGRTGNDPGLNPNGWPQPVQPAPGLRGRTGGQGPGPTFGPGVAQQPNARQDAWMQGRPDLPQTPGSYYTGGGWKTDPRLAALGIVSADTSWDDMLSGQWGANPGSDAYRTQMGQRGQFRDALQQQGLLDNFQRYRRQQGLRGAQNFDDALMGFAGQRQDRGRTPNGAYVAGWGVEGSDQQGYARNAINLAGQQAPAQPHQQGIPAVPYQPGAPAQQLQGMPAPAVPYTGPPAPAVPYQPGAPPVPYQGAPPSAQPQAPAVPLQGAPAPAAAPPQGVPPQGLPAPAQPPFQPSPTFGPNVLQPQNAPSLPSTAPQSPQVASNIHSGLQGLGQPAPQQAAPPPTAPPAPGLQGLPPAQAPSGGLQGLSPAPPPVNDQNPGADANSLMLNPQYEAGVRALDDELSATLAQIGVSRQEAQGINKLIKERLGIERGEDLSATDEAANARGLFDSGIRTTNRNRVERGYRQQGEDIDIDFARTLRDLASGEMGARSGHSKGLAELLMGVANSMAEKNNSPIGMSTREPRKPPPKKKRRRRRKRR